MILCNFRLRSANTVSCPEFSQSEARRPIACAARQITRGLIAATTMSTKYLPEIIYALALTSLSTHMLWQRKDSADQRAHYTARVKLLEDTAQRLRAGQDVPQSDFDLIDKMAREPGVDRAAARGTEPLGSIGWREVLLGRKDGNSAQTEYWEAKDWEEG